MDSKDVKKEIIRGGNRTLVVLTHIPTGISARCSHHASQYQNSRAAMKELESKVDAYERLTQPLLGCEWGRSVMTPDDQDPCTERAVQIIVVHNGPAKREIKLCAKHKERLEQETVPHVEEDPKVIGTATEHSIQDPFTGEITVDVRLDGESD